MRASIIIFVLLSANLSSQNLFEIGNKWIFDFYIYEQNINPNKSVATVSTLEAHRDTIINNVSYVVLKASEDHQCSIFSDGEIVRDFGGQIYKYLPSYNYEVLLYNYNNLGQYDIEYGFDQAPMTYFAEVQFDSIGFSKSYDGRELEIQYSKIIGNGSYDDDHQYKYIKDIGFKHVLPDLGTGLCDFFGDIIGDMRCFVQANSDTTYFTQYNCSETVTKILNSSDDIAISNNIKVYPNPSNGRFTVEGEYDSALLSNLMGQKIAIDFNNGEFTVDNNLKGVFMLELRLGKQVTYQKILFE